MLTFKELLQWLNKLIELQFPTINAQFNMKLHSRAQGEERTLGKPEYPKHILSAASLHGQSRSR
jgi:hypothetical protein